MRLLVIARHASPSAEGWQSGELGTDTPVDKVTMARQQPVSGGVLPGKDDRSNWNYSHHSDEIASSRHRRADSQWPAAPEILASKTKLPGPAWFANIRAANTP